MSTRTTSPSVLVTEELAKDLVQSGGYTHPLFHPESDADRPLPGQAVLLLMGGLVEQSGALDHAVALLELRSTRFLKMVKPGVRLHVEIELDDPGPSSRATTQQVVRWTAVTADGAAIAESEVLMLVRSVEPGESR